MPLPPRSLSLHDVTVLAQGLKTNAKLASLGLWKNPIGDDGAVALADALRVNTALKSVALHACGITANGTAHLLDALISMVDVRQCAVQRKLSSFPWWPFDSVRCNASSTALRAHFRGGRSTVCDATQAHLLHELISMVDV